MKHRRFLTALLCAVCLLCAGCQTSSTRTVLMDARSDTDQTGQSQNDGSLREIRSFPMEMTVDGQDIDIVRIYGWMDETRLWCETVTNDIKSIATVDDSFGFYKELEEIGEYISVFGTSPDGRYVVYARCAGGESDKDFIDVMLYDSVTGQSKRLMQSNGNSYFSSSSLCFSNDGRYMSMLMESYKYIDEEDMVYEIAGVQMNVVIFDLETDTFSEFEIIDDLSNRARAYYFKITQVESMNDVYGWLTGYDWEYGGQFNALNIRLEDGFAYPIDQDSTGRVVDLQMFNGQLDRMGGLVILQDWNAISQGIYWYDHVIMAQTADRSLLAIDLETGDLRVLAESVGTIAIAPDGLHIAFCTWTNTGGMEIYTARIALDATGMPALENRQIVYTGKSVSLKFWNQDGSKLIIAEDDEKDKTAYYRVLTFNTGQQ